MARIHPGDSYFAAVLPSLAVFGAGLAALITPITATVLASVDARHSGIASAVNNALSRLGQMIAVAALPLAAGLSGADFEDPVKLAAGFPVAMTIAAGASFAAALLAWTTIRDDALSRPGSGHQTRGDRRSRRLFSDTARWPGPRWPRPPIHGPVPTRRRTSSRDHPAAQRI